jgi:hypothetical protein
MLVDRSRLSSDAAVPLDETGAPDLGLTDLFKNGLGEAERADATHFTGTVDVTAADGLLAPSDKTMQKAGTEAKSVPFTATIDDKGRLTAFREEPGSIDPELGMELTFTGFGSVQPVSKPTGAIPATEAVYKMFS